MTYAELDQRTNQLAHHLQTLGVGRDVPVAVLMERSFDLVVAVMGMHLDQSQNPYWRHETIQSTSNPIVSSHTSMSAHCSSRCLPLL